MVSKKIKIYASEIKDGLEQAIASSCSIACVSDVNPCEDFDISKFESSMKALAGEDVTNTHILYPLKSIMVSTGRNKNDDVFLPAPLWEARHTPEDKPFNFEHKDDVIGHITSNYCIASDGSVLDDNIASEDIPDQFDIVTYAVIYREWKSQENKDRIANLIKEIAEQKYSVSMECLFSNFDYMLLENEGTEKAIASLVQRKRDTAYLTKHLRAYGGTGVYDGKKVMRVLRNITFSGKGLVKKPANPRSVILQDVESVIASDELVYTNMSKNKESSMAENLLEKENAELKLKIEKLEKDAQEKNQAELKAQASKFETEANELKDKNKELKSELDKTIANLNEVSKAKAEFEVKLAKLDEEKKTAERISAVASSLELEPEKAAKICASLMKLDDESFNEWVKTQAGYEAEKKAMYQGSTPPAVNGDPMKVGSKPVVAGSKPSEPTPLAVIKTAGVKSYDKYTVNLAKGTKPVNLPAGVTASVTADPVEPTVDPTVLDNAEPQTPALAGVVTDDKVEGLRTDIAGYFGMKKESK